MATTHELSVEEITNALINANAAMLESFVSLLNKIESDIINTDGEILQGEAEEILREILQIAGNGIESAIALQEQLQTRFVESYFPAQD